MWYGRFSQIVVIFRIIFSFGWFMNIYTVSIVNNATPKFWEKILDVASQKLLFNCEHILKIIYIVRPLVKFAMFICTIINANATF